MGLDDPVYRKGRPQPKPRTPCLLELGAIFLSRDDEFAKWYDRALGHRGLAMTQIERAARALCRSNGLPENIQFEGRPMWESFIPHAMAVIEALEKPDSGKRH